MIASGRQSYTAQCNQVNEETFDSGNSLRHRMSCAVMRIVWIQCGAETVMNTKLQRATCSRYSEHMHGPSSLRQTTWRMHFTSNDSLEMTQKVVATRVKMSSSHRASHRHFKWQHCLHPAEIANSLAGDDVEKRQHPNTQTVEECEV